MKPRISVILINYNYARYLPDAIESVLAQDIGERLEILVIDDGSTDDSKEKVARFGDRMRWISKPNGGQVSAFNTGSQAATGEFVALLEADDLWERDKLRKSLARLEAEPEAALAQHWMLQVDADNRPLPGFQYPTTPDSFGLNEAVWEIPYACTSSIVYRAERLRPYLPLPDTLLFGADVCLRLIAATLGPIANVPEPLGRRRLHGNNLFGTTLYDDAAKLVRTRPMHVPMLDFKRRHFQRMSLTLDPAYLRFATIEQHMSELFLFRYRGKWRAAARAWLDVVRASGPRSYTLFKGAAAFLALLSPALYLRVHEGYAGSPALIKLRRSLWR